MARELWPDGGNFPVGERRPHSSCPCDTSLYSISLFLILLFVKPRAHPFCPKPGGTVCVLEPGAPVARRRPLQGMADQDCCVWPLSHWAVLTAQVPVRSCFRINSQRDGSAAQCEALGSTPVPYRKETEEEMEALLRRETLNSTWDPRD